MIQDKQKHISKGYKSDIKQYRIYCPLTVQHESLDSVLDYFYVSIVDQQVKKSTLEKRLSVLKRYFEVNYEVDFQSEINLLKDFSHIRGLYDEEENNEWNKMTS